MTTPPETNGLIGAARARVAEARAAIRDVDAEMRARVAERAPLLRSVDPDDIARASALTTAIDRLRAMLPVAGAKDGAWRPELQRALELAEAELVRVRQQRATLARDLDELRELEGHIGARLPELRATLATAYQIMQSARWPTAELRQQGADNLSRLGGVRSFVEGLHSRLASIPGWEARLAELGDDPG